MPSVEVPLITLSITAVPSAGAVTVSSTENIFPGARGVLVDAAGTTIEDAIVVKILTLTDFQVRIINTEFPSYGLSDVSAFNGGTFTQYAQPVPVEPTYAKIDDLAEGGGGGGGGGGAPPDAKYVVKTPHLGLPNEFALSTLATGILKVTTTTGNLTIAVSNTDFASPLATYITQTATNAPANSQALGALTAGVLSVLATTGVIESTAFTANQVAYGSGTNGKLTANAEFTYINATKTVLNLGDSASFRAQAYLDTSAGYFVGRCNATSIGYVAFYGTTFVGTGSAQAGAAELRSDIAGGVSIAGAHASGAVRVYAAGSAAANLIATFAPSVSTFKTDVDITKTNPRYTLHGGAATDFTSNDFFVNSVTLGQLQTFGSGYTPAGGFKASGLALIANQSGGMSLIASNASGAVRVYSGGTADGNLVATFAAALATIATDVTIEKSTAGTLNIKSTTATSYAANIFHVNSTVIGELDGLGASYVTSGALKASGMYLGGAGVGGLSLAAQSASGTVRVYSAGIADANLVATFGAPTTIGLQMNSRIQEKMGTSTASAGDLTLPNDGNSIPITGTTTINAITTTNWQAGAVVRLFFSGILTVNHDTAGGAGTAKIKLAGSAGFTTAAGSNLTLVYDGTTWNETARTTL